MGRHQLFCFRVLVSRIVATNRRSRSSGQVYLAFAILRTQFELDFTTKSECQGDFTGGLIQITRTSSYPVANVNSPKFLTNTLQIYQNLSQSNLAHLASRACDTPDTGGFVAKVSRHTCIVYCIQVVCSWIVEERDASALTRRLSITESL